MSNYQTEGVIRHLHDTQAFASGFAKREFVIETNAGKYPQMLKFECVKDKCALLDRFQVGQSVVIDFDVRGSEYKERFYVNLLAWKIEAGGNPPQDRTAQEARGQAPRDNGASEGDGGDDLDIPFNKLQTVFQP